MENNDRYYVILHFYNEAKLSLEKYDLENKTFIALLDYETDVIISKYLPITVKEKELYCENHDISYSEYLENQYHDFHKILQACKIRIDFKLRKKTIFLKNGQKIILNYNH